jgi:hypothetical protein
MSSELIREIDQILNLLESSLPASMSSAENKRLENSFRKSMAVYFDSLLKAFPFAELERLYSQNVKEVAPPKRIPPPGDWEWLDTLINTFKVDLLYRVNSHMATIYIAGSAQMISYGKTKLGIPILFEGPPISQAVDWAKKYGAQLVTKMDEETKTRLAQIISDGIQNKRGIQGLARDIRKEFSDMSKARSELIAHSETGNALGQSFLDRGRDMGIDGKEWILGAGGVQGNCDDCLANAAAGVIPFEEPFPGGVMTVLQHPRCSCAVAPAMLNRID